MSSSALVSKVVLSTLSTILYGGGTGGIIGGTLGLGSNQAEILNEERSDSYALQIRKPVRVERKPSVGDSDFYNKNPKEPPAYVAAAGSKLPEGFVNRHIYQMKSSEEFEKNHKSFYCTKEHFDELIVGTEKQNRGDLRKRVVTTDRGDRGFSRKCVNVVGHREYFGDTKGRGSLKLIYTIEYNDFAAMILSVITADDGKIEVDGANYTLQKILKPNDKYEGKMIAGTQAKKQEVNLENQNRLIILPGNSIQNKTDKGGFDFDPANVCQKDECFSDPTKTEYSDRVGKAEKGYTDENNKTYKARDGSSNYSAGVAKNGLFPYYDCTFGKDKGDYFKEFGKSSDSYF